MLQFPMFGSWNIRGLNGYSKQRAVKSWISDCSLSLIGLLETKVALGHLDSVVSKICPSWHYISNASNSVACRVLVCWDPTVFSITSTHMSSQDITCQVTRLADGIPFGITFVYESNDPGCRRLLWDFLGSQARVFSSLPWVVLGDFNVILRASDRVGGDSAWYSHMDDFGQCVHSAELVSCPYTGLRFTWHNGQQGEGSILRKLDWVLCSSSWFMTWPGTIFDILPRTVSDHCAMVVRVGALPPKRPSSFKFLNFWADRVDFLGIVQRVWDIPLGGSPMFRVTQKLSLLKRELRALHARDSSHISARVVEVRGQWAAAQATLDEDPSSTECLATEHDLAKSYYRLCHEEEAFYKQRSRVQWLSLGDKNTKFFHRSLVHRQVRNRIHSLLDEDGSHVTDQRGLGQLAVRYFQGLFSAPSQPSFEGVSRVITSRIFEDVIPSLIADISDEEIRSAMFSIPDDKALGPDGYTALFFKRAWDIIGLDIMSAVRHFFATNELPRCVSATRIALVPKVESPLSMSDFRPISCCNVLYKCISKVIVNRFKEVLPGVIGSSQSAFVPGRRISDNILLTQELMRNYHIGGAPRCALKVDIRKAFDTMSWEFILLGLRTIGLSN